MARVSLSIAGLALVTALLGSVASSPAQNFGMIDGAKSFTVDWERGEFRGKPSVHGYINNRWGRAATNLRVTVEGLDATGTVISTTIDRIPGDVARGLGTTSRSWCPPRRTTASRSAATVAVVEVAVAAAEPVGCSSGISTQRRTATVLAINCRRRGCSDTPFFSQCPSSGAS